MYDPSYLYVTTLLSMFQYWSQNDSSVPAIKTPERAQAPGILQRTQTKQILAQWKQAASQKVIMDRHQMADQGQNKFGVCQKGKAREREREIGIKGKYQEQQ